MGEGSVTRERILSEALDVFGRNGYGGARMEQIAAQAGLNKASLYFYFKSKKELFQELFSTIVRKHDALIKQIIAASEGLPTRERLTVIYNTYLNDHRDNREMDFWNMIYYFPPEDMKEEIRLKTLDNKSFFLEILRPIFEDGIRRNEIRPLDPKRMAKTFYYLLTCVTLSVDMLEPSQGLSEMDECFSVFWEGVRC
jgi:AcrR family transcriptional regulator